MQVLITLPKMWAATIGGLAKEMRVAGYICSGADCCKRLSWCGANVHVYQIYIVGVHYGIRLCR
jgi:hypothetical protein